MKDRVDYHMAIIWYFHVRPIKMDFYSAGVPDNFYLNGNCKKKEPPTLL